MYDSIYNFSNIKRAFYSARHSKLNNPSANRFEINMLSECVRLSDELRYKKYTTGKSTKFKVYYPKERDIESSTFQDKLCSILIAIMFSIQLYAIGSFMIISHHSMVKALVLV